MLEARQLSCIRDERILFDSLSFMIQPGELVQIEGPNGSGKTSLLRILVGLLQPNEGEVCWQGTSIQHCREQFNHSLLYLGHQPGIKTLLTPFENLLFFQKVQRIPYNVEMIWQALENVGLLGYEDTPVHQLSAGQQRRVALARLWFSQASLWILDEPLTAIDKDGIEQLVMLFSHFVKQGKILLLATHQEMSTLDYPLRKITLTGEG